MISEKCKIIEKVIEEFALNSEHPNDVGVKIAAQNLHFALENPLYPEDALVQRVEDVCVAYVATQAERMNNWGAGVVIERVRMVVEKRLGVVVEDPFITAWKRYCEAD